jgi:DNA-binding transcriptional MerR regulator
MVNREVVLETIHKMKESGIDDSVVAQTLRDIGMKDAEIGQYLEEARSLGQNAQQQPPAYAPASSGDLMDHLERKAEEDALHHEMVHNKLDEHTEHIQAVSQRVEDLHQKFGQIAGSGAGSQDSGQLALQLATLNQRISELERQLADAKAIISANKTIMEKILEVDRKILTKL